MCVDLLQIKVQLAEFMSGIILRHKSACRKTAFYQFSKSESYSMGWGECVVLKHIASSISLHTLQEQHLLLTVQEIVLMVVWGIFSLMFVAEISLRKFVIKFKLH